MARIPDLLETPTAVFRCASYATNDRVIRALLRAPFVWTERVFSAAQSFGRAFKLWILLMELAHSLGIGEYEECLIKALDVDPLATQFALYPGSPFMTHCGINFGRLRRAISEVLVDDTNFDAFVTRAADIFGQGLVREIRNAAKWVPKESCVRRARGTPRYPIVKAVFDQIVNSYFAGSRSEFRRRVRYLNVNCLEQCLANGFTDQCVKIGKGATKRYKNILIFKNRKVVFSGKPNGHRFAKPPQERVPQFVFRQFVRVKETDIMRKRRNWVKSIKIPVLSLRERALLSNFTVTAYRRYGVLKKTVNAFGSTFQSETEWLFTRQEAIHLRRVPHTARSYPWAVQWYKRYNISFEDLALYKLIARRRSRGHVSKHVRMWLND